MSKQFWVMRKGTEAARRVCSGEELHPALYVSHNSHNKTAFPKSSTVLLSVIWQDSEGRIGLALIHMVLRLHGISYIGYDSLQKNYTNYIRITTIIYTIKCLLQQRIDHYFSWHLLISVTMFSTIIDQDPKWVLPLACCFSVLLSRVLLLSEQPASKDLKHWASWGHYSSAQGHTANCLACRSSK